MSNLPPVLRLSSASPAESLGEPKFSRRPGSVATRF